LAPGEPARGPAGVRGRHMVGAAVETALVDLVDARRGVSLASAIGATREAVPVCAVVGIAPTIDELLARVERAGTEGYQAVKLKIRDGWDLEPLRAVRGTWPALPLAADANGVYDRARATELAPQVDELGLLYLEQ